MILEGGKSVGHCRVSGVTRFGEKTEIGQLQFPDQPGPLQLPGRGSALAVACVQENQGNDHELYYRYKAENGGFSHQRVTIEDVTPETSGRSE